MLRHRSPRHGLTQTELVALLAVVGLVLVLAVLAISGMRARARRTACVDNLRLLGQAVLQYEQARQRYPVSSTFPVGRQARCRVGDQYDSGLSWIVQLLPYLGEPGPELHARLKVTIVNPATQQEQPASPWFADYDQPTPGENYNRQISQTPLPFLRCPSFSGGAYCDRAVWKLDQAAISNYVALGAGTYNRLFGGDPTVNSGLPQPDGLIRPASPATAKELADGAGQTVIACETREPVWAPWADGGTAAVFGLRPLSIRLADFETGPDGRSLRLRASVDAATNLQHGNRAGGDTLLDRYLPLDTLPFVPGDRVHEAAVPWTFGPSSEHGTVNHLFADGSVRSLSRDVQPGVYLQLITIAGDERNDVLGEPGISPSK